MTCETFKVGEGFAIVCNRGKRWPRCSVPGCDRPAPFLCDFSVSRKKSGTCDAKLCEGHAVAQPSHHRVEPGSTPDRVDFCPPHARHVQGGLPL
jgi:hypothetical protein